MDRVEWGLGMRLVFHRITAALPHVQMYGRASVTPQLLSLSLTQYDGHRIEQLSQRLIAGITSRLDNVVRNGDPEQTYPGVHH